MYALSQQVLRTDASGMPLEWIDYKEAVRLYCLGQVAYSFGQPLFQLRGGTNARTGERTVVEISSIVATVGQSKQSRPPAPRLRAAAQQRNTVPARRPPLHVLRPALRVRAAVARSRDAAVAWRPGRVEQRRDGLPPLQQPSRPGARRSRRSLQLIAIPFTPSYAEYIYLKGRRVLADQMEYLLAHFPRSSPLHKRLSAVQP